VALVEEPHEVDRRRPGSREAPVDEHEPVGEQHGVAEVRIGMEQCQPVQLERGDER